MPGRQRAHTAIATAPRAAAGEAVQIDASAAELISAADALDRKTLRRLLKLCAFALAAGATSGAMVFWLVNR